MQKPPTFAGRLIGMATIMGGVLWAVGGSTALNYEDLGLTMRGPHVVLSVGGLLTLLGLGRLASYRLGDDGLSRRTGVILAGAGVAVIIASKNLPSSVSEDAAWNVFYLGGLVLVMGSLLFAIPTLRIRRGRLIAAPLLAIGVLGISNLVLLMTSMGASGGTEYEYVGTWVLPISIGLAWAVLGYGLWAYEARPVGDRQVAEAGIGAQPKVPKSPETVNSRHGEVPG